MNKRLTFVLGPWSLVIVLMLLTACGNREPAAPPTPTLDPLAEQGRLVFQHHCGSCHAIAGETIIMGPSLAGIVARAGGRIEGLDARQYLELSILKPDAFLVPGFANQMPADFGRKLTSEELNRLVAYLMTLQ